MRDPGWKRVKTVSLDEESLVSIQVQNQRRDLENRIEEERSRQRHERSLVLVRQSRIDRDAPDPQAWLKPVAKSSLAFSVFTGVYGLIAGGVSEYFQVVPFLGFMIRPHIVVALLTALLWQSLGHYRLKAMQARNDVASIQDPAWMKGAEAALEYCFWILIASLGFSIFGWEPALTLLGGPKATVGMFLVAGVFLRFAWRLMPR